MKKASYSSIEDGETENKGTDWPSGKIAAAVLAALALGTVAVAGVGPLSPAVDEPSSSSETVLNGYDAPWFDADKKYIHANNNAECGCSDGEPAKSEHCKEDGTNLAS